MAHVIVRDHKGDYGFDGSFRTISVRGQAIGVAAQAAVWSCRTAALPRTSSIGVAASAARADRDVQPVAGEEELGSLTVTVTRP